ncbi:hypothetical protein QJS64_19170 (plasmid) [Paraclostridium bifermentans]|uniref:Uncharacterized protein n=1 Tax=Paraclostridium bifermentans TaxID=1490 RepID=A0ABY8R742_PARBF|nr:hypothetical protein QJS64_19170 [Paraclostridium bifermentans]
MDRYLKEFCEIERIDIKELDDKQIHILEKSCFYNGFKLRRSLQELADSTIVPIIVKLSNLFEKENN